MSKGKKGELETVPVENAAGDLVAVEFTEKRVEKKRAVMGRPTLFNDKVAYTICERIIEGESLRTICKDDDMPAISTVFMWLDTKPDFLDNYTRAKDNQADTNSEDIQELAKRVIAGEVDPQAARVAIDAYKWTASKLKPKKYGDKIDHTTNGKDLPTPILGTITQQIEAHTDVIDLE